ncbi:hypothetical protein [Methylobacterium sp. CM6244]
MNTFSDVIDALGIAVTASILGISESHARTLKARDSIPPAYFKRLVDSDEGKEKGVTFDLLFGLLENVPDRKAKSSSAEAAA